MLDSATKAGDRDRDLHPAPPLLVLQPAHLRFYGFDSDLSIPSERKRPKGSDTPASNSHLTVFPSTVVANATESPRAVGNDGGIGAGVRHASAAPGKPEADAFTDQGDSPLQRTRTEAPQESAGSPEMGRDPPACRRRGKLPLAPPPLSARCQLHPVVMRDLGLRAGDPVVVLALSKGWIYGGTAGLASASPSLLPSYAVGVVEPRGRGARDAPNRFPVATLGDGRPEAGYGVAGADVDEVKAEVEACRRGVESLGLAAFDEGEQRRQKEELQPAQPQDQERRRVAASLADGVAKKLRCFLCTAWTNPHLALGEAAVDGRVNIPLPSNTTSAALAALHCLLDVSQSPPEEAAGATEPPSRRPSDTTGPVSEDIVARFLRSTIERHLFAPRGDAEDENGADTVVGIIPASALCDGDFGVDTIGWGRAGRCGDSPPIAGRISARVLATLRRTSVCMADVGGGSPEKESAALPPAEDRRATTFQQRQLQQQLEQCPQRGQRQQQHQQQGEQQQQQHLPPAYTSLIKRSLRHLVVSNGCEVAVPSYPDRTGTTLGGASAASGSGTNGRSIVGGSGSGQRLPQGDGTSTLRIEINGGGGDSQGSGAAFTGLFGGAVCVVGPESLVLVEAGEIPGAGSADSNGTGLRHGEGGSWEGGKERDEGRRPCEVIPAYNPKTSKLSPTDALVELILLPMTATSLLSAQGDAGLKPLEFSLPRGVLLTGPPGVGKTFAVRSAVETVRNFGSSAEGADDGPFQVKLTTLNGAEILSLGQWGACQALREAFSAAENWSKGRDTGGRGSSGAHTRDQQRREERVSGSRCAVIFLDEADALLARRDRDGDKAGGGEGARALAQLLTLMDGFHGAGGSSHVIVVGATNRPGALDPALRRPGRFDQELALAPPDVKGRADILRHHLRGVKVVGGEATIDAAALSCVGFVGADLAALAREAALLAARSQASQQLHFDGKDQRSTAPAPAPPMEATVGPAHLSAAMEKVGASSLRGHQVTVPQTPWSDIGGMEEAKAKLRQAVEWPVANKAAFDRMGLTPPRGILLFGPPGCSKTTLVRAAATAAGATFVCLSGADVFSPYLGEAEAAVRQAFRIARNAAPALLFFDELDAIVCKRGGVGDKGSANSAESRVLATFLTEMDGVGSLRGDGVVVVGATNRPEAVDRALLRPGRFDQVVYAPLPEEDARRQIFEVHTKKMAVDREGVDFLTLASICKGLTGAEIEGVCREAAMSAIREAGFGSDGDTRAGSAITTTATTKKASGSRTAGAGVHGTSTSTSTESEAKDLYEESKMRQQTPRTKTSNVGEEDGESNEEGRRNATEKTTDDGETEEGQLASRGATVTMRHLMAAARAAATRPGVTREMIKAYDRFAAGL